MSKGLRAWVKANWVDIANPKKGGGFQSAVEAKEKKNYPKCVPAAKARAMTPAKTCCCIKKENC